MTWIEFAVHNSLPVSSIVPIPTNFKRLKLVFKTTTFKQVIEIDWNDLRIGSNFIGSGISAWLLVGVNINTGTNVLELGISNLGTATGQPVDIYIYYIK